MADNQNNKRPQQSNLSLGLRVLVLLYVLYLAYGIVEAYWKGSTDALSLPLTIAAAGILGAAAIVLLALTYRQWRAQRAEGSPEQAGSRSEALDDGPEEADGVSDALSEPDEDED